VVVPAVVVPGVVVPAVVVPAAPHRAARLRTTRAPLLVVTLCRPAPRRLAVADRRDRGTGHRDRPSLLACVVRRDTARCDQGQGCTDPDGYPAATVPREEPQDSPPRNSGGTLTRRLSHRGRNTRKPARNAPPGPSRAPRTGGSRGHGEGAPRVTQPVVRCAWRGAACPRRCRGRRRDRAPGR
jgi:hypothetical protein